MTPPGGQGANDRWTEQRRRFEPVVDSYPWLEAAWHSVFWTLLERREEATTASRIRHVAKQLVPPRKRRVSPGVAEVVLLLEHHRGMLAETLIPLHSALRARGVTTRVVSVPRASTSAGVVGDVDILSIAPRPTLDPDRRRAFAALRAAFPELTARQAGTFVEIAATAAAMQREVGEVVRRLGASAVVVSRDRQLLAAAAIAGARDEGATTLALQHGMVAAADLPLVADQVLAWGSLTAERLAPFGGDPRRFATTGSPRHDGAASMDRAAARADVRRLLGDADHVVTFFSNGEATEVCGEESIRSATRWVHELARRAPADTQVVVKLHPAESGDRYTPGSGLHIVKNEVDALTLLAGTDVAVANYSTVLDEALLFATPVLQLTRPEWPAGPNNAQIGAALPIGNADELVTAVDELRPGAERDRVVSAQAAVLPRAFANIGSAVHATADHIAGLL